MIEILIGIMFFNCLCGCWFGFDAVDEDMQLALAHQLYKSGNYKQALDHSNAVYDQNSLRTDNLLLLGAIYYQVKKLPFVSLILLEDFDFVVL